MILCQHKNKDEEEARISKPDIYSPDEKGDFKFRV